MDDLSKVRMLSFNDELEKLGWTPNFSDVTKRMIGTAGSMGGVGAGLGGVLGAGVQGYRGYRQAKEQGATTGQAVGAGLGKSLKGAVVGAGIGAGAGVAGGAALGKLSPQVAERAVGAVQSFGPAKTLSDYGQRQAHWMTGWKPEGGLGSIGMGSTPVKAQLEAAEQRLGQLRQPGSDQGRLGAVIGADRARKLREFMTSRDVSRMQKHVGALDAAENMGLTSLPGMAHSVRTHGLLPTIGAGMKEQWHSGGPIMKSLMFGLPAYQMASGLAHRDEEGGRASMAQGAGMLATTALGPLPATAQMLASPFINKAFNRMAGVPKPPAPEEASATSSAPVERYESNAYRGLPPEGSVG